MLHFSNTYKFLHTPGILIGFRQYLRRRIERDNDNYISSDVNTGNSADKCMYECHQPINYFANAYNILNMKICSFSIAQNWG